MPLYLTESRAVRYGTFFALYAAEGLPAGFAGTALFNYLAAEGVGPEAVGAFAAAAGLPWVFQFVWGPVVDRFQGSPMGRRRAWVVGAQALAAVASLGLLLVGDPVGDVWALGLAFLVLGVFAAVQDAAVDALAISVTPPAERGRTNAVMRGGFLVGLGAGAAVLSQVLRHGGFHAAAAAHSAVLLALTAATAGVRERPGDALLPWGRRPAGGEGLTAPPAAAGSVRRIVAEAAGGLVSGPSVRLFGPVLLAYAAATVFFSAYSVHLIQRLGWRDDRLSAVSGTMGTLAALAVTVAGGALSDWVGNRRLLRLVMLWFGGFLGAFGLLGSGLVAPSWSNPAVATAGLLAGSVVDPLLSVAAMPVLMAVCRRGVEGSQFTAYMALVNLAGVAGAFVAGRAAAHVPAPAIGAMCGLAVLGATVVAGPALVAADDPPAGPAAERAT